jgi:hypothetical protein
MLPFGQLKNIIWFEYEMEQLPVRDKSNYGMFIHVTKQLIDLMGAQPLSHTFEEYYLLRSKM